jgi:ABC-type uncharacterized transport system auxiliary subunit
MRPRWHLLIALLFYFLSMPIESAEVVVDGAATIHDNDYGQARELAIRRAMSRAVESQGARVNSQTIVRPGMVLESIQVRSTAYAGNSQIIKETISKDVLTVTMKVVVNELGSTSTSCQSNYVKKIVVLDFGFEFSDQVLLEEKSIFKYKTAGEIARAIRKHQRLQVDFEGMSFPYFSPSSAPEPFTQKSHKGNPFVEKADVHNAQYILSGVYRDFGITSDINNKQTRRIEIEAFLHDGADGALLDREIFISSATGSVTLSDSPALGTPLFYQTNFGKVWGGVLDNIAKWVDEKVSCLPFISRIVKIEGHQLYISTGANSGLYVGDTLNLQVSKRSEHENVDSSYIGTEVNLYSTASLVSVYPSFSILEMLEKPETIAKIRAGDLLYIR